MKRKILTALAPTLLGTAASVACLVKTTPLTMTLFFFIGLPGFAIGFVLWAMMVLKDLKEHKVL